MSLLDTLRRVVAFTSFVGVKSLAFYLDSAFRIRILEDHIRPPTLACVLLELEMLAISPWHNPHKVIYHRALAYVGRSDVT